MLEWSWIETLGFTYKQYLDFDYYYETIAKRLHASATQLLRIDIMLTSYLVINVITYLNIYHWFNVIGGSNSDA